MNVLFLCKSNAFRSQMAEGFFNKFSKKNRAKSAALDVPVEVPDLVREVMKEKRIEISKNVAKKVIPEMIDKADLIVLMSPDLSKYVKTNLKMEIWNIPDITGEETEEELHAKFIEARNRIEAKVKELIERIV